MGNAYFFQQRYSLLFNFRQIWFEGGRFYNEESIPPCVGKGDPVKPLSIKKRNKLSLLGMRESTEELNFERQMHSEPGFADSAVNRTACFLWFLCVSSAVFWDWTGSFHEFSFKHVVNDSVLEAPEVPGWPLCRDRGCFCCWDQARRGSSFWRSQHPPCRLEASRCKEEDEEVMSPLCIPGLRFSPCLHVPNRDYIC